jgi:hypothetical protein
VTPPPTDAPEDDVSALEPSAVQEARRWSDGRWTAQVHRNDDEGWAVSMTLAGQSEPALVGPWTMGRDKKNPKPLDVNAFHTLVKTAHEVLRRHEQQRDAELHRRVAVNEASGRITVCLDIVPDEDQPEATLTALDEAGETLGHCRVAPNFRLTSASASAWIAGGYQKPR